MACLGPLVIQGLHQLWWRVDQLGLKRQSGLLLHLLLTHGVDRVFGASGCIRGTYSSEVVNGVVALPVVVSWATIQTIWFPIKVHRSPLSMRSSSKVKKVGSTSTRFCRDLVASIVACLVLAWWLLLHLRLVVRHHRRLINRQVVMEIIVPNIHARKSHIWILDWMSTIKWRKHIGASLHWTSSKKLSCPLLRGPKHLLLFLIHRSHFAITASI